MVEWRRRSSKARQARDFSSDRTTRAIDTEIDMRRLAPRRSTVAHNFKKLIRWMTPQGNSIGPPMRSVARELEEAFPSEDQRGA